MLLKGNFAECSCQEIQFGGRLNNYL